MTSRRNTAILLTPPGAAAIAVVRLSGAETRTFLARHFSQPVPMGRCVHGELRDGETALDDPVVVLTTETTADVNVHGGPWVVGAALDLARRAGFEVMTTEVGSLADPAVDAETILEREVLAYLPLAKTELALRVLLAQEGAWRAAIASDVIDPGRVLNDHALVHLLHPPRVAVVGPANVGKSTLANRLFARERSITADLPGTTRDWVGEIANLDGLAVMLIDTPGLRETADPIERQAIEQSRPAVAAADLVVVVLDATRPPEGEQAQLRERFPGAIVVVNKSDRAADWDAAAVGGIATIATTGEGIDALRTAIRSRFGCEAIDVAQPRYWTPRQRELLKRAAGDPHAYRECLDLICGTGASPMPRQRPI